MKHIITILTLFFFLHVLIAQEQSDEYSKAISDIYSTNNSYFSFNEDEDIIDITSPHISLLKVFIDLEKIESSGARSFFGKKIKDNMHWTGVFDVIDDKMQADYVLSVYQGFFSDFYIEFNNFELNGIFKEKLKYFSDNAAKTEQSIIQAVNKIVLLLTGEASSLGGNLLYLEKKNGQLSKDIIMTDTHNFFSKRLVSNGMLNFNPRITSSGEKFSYITLTPNGYVINIFDFKLDRSFTLTKTHDLISGGSWLEGGKRLAVTISSKGNSDVYILDAENGKIIEKLTSLTSIENSPSVASDGSIAFVSDKSGSPQIYLYEGKKNLMNRLTFKGKYNTEPRWNLKNDIILYSSFISGSMELMLYNFINDQTSRITKSGKSAEQASWSPDGRRIIYSRKFSDQQKIYMINLDARYQRRLSFTKNDVIESDPEWFPIAWNQSIGSE